MKTTTFGRNLIMALTILLVGALGVPRVGLATLDSGLVAYWSFDECSGDTVHDYSGNNNHGINYGASWVQGISGCGLEFVDTDICRFIPSSFDDSFTTSFTIASWVEFYGESSYGSYNLLFDARDGYGRQAGFNLRLNSSGTICLYFADGSIWHMFCSADKVPLNEPTHIAAVYDYVSETVSFFINGAKDTTHEAPFLYAQTTISAAIGNNRWAPGDHRWKPFNGTIDELRIYDRALSDAEIESLYFDVPRGDANEDGVIDLGDVLYLTNYLYKDGPAPVPLYAGDCNCDGVIDIGDVLYLINYLYKGGLPPGCGGASQFTKESVGCNTHHSLQKTAGPAQVGLVSSGTSKEGNKLMEVVGSFETQVGGVQFEFSYDPKEIQRIIPELTDRTKDLNLFFSDECGELRIGMVDLTGKHLIPAGEGSLVRLAITGSDVSSLAFEQAILVDENANHFQVTVLPKEETKATLPQDFALLQNYPNPFNPETQISYVLPNACQVKLSIYNLLGQRIRTLVDQYQAAGHQTAHWDGTDEQGNEVASGIYFYRIQAGEFTDAKKMILMK